jgi:hypothetical protein
LIETACCLCLLLPVLRQPPCGASHAWRCHPPPPAPCHTAHTPTCRHADSSGTVIGTTLHHWEYYKGALAPLVMSDRYGFKVKSFLSTTVSRQNK